MPCAVSGEGGINISCHMPFLEKGELTLHVIYAVCGGGELTFHVICRFWGGGGVNVSCHVTFLGTSLSFLVIYGYSLS